MPSRLNTTRKKKVPVNGAEAKVQLIALLHILARQAVRELMSELSAKAADMDKEVFPNDTQ